MTPSQAARRPKRNRRRPPGTRYSTSSYRKAIHRACLKAKIEKWSPNRLRHTAASEFRRNFGLEAAQTILGHSQADVTQMYAERDYSLAKRVIREVG
jgi:integrase